MEYLKAVELLKEIEGKYDVMSIKYKGVSVWPQFRVYLMSTLATHSEQELSGSAVKLILGSLFFYNPLQLFKKYDIWQFNSCITRKKVGGKFVHHVSGLVPQLGYKTLQWELPIPGVRHYKRSEIEEKHIISSSWWILLSRGLALLGKWKNIRLENEDLIKSILSEYDIQFDYKSSVKRLIWLKRVADFFFSISKKPRLIVVECAYTQMGMVWSAHKHEIPVVELQHGVLNAHHYGYNPTFHSEELYPDEICVYGDVEYDYFVNHSRQYARKVSIMGMYMLECADKYFNKDIFEDYRSSYSKIVVVAGETGLEEILSTFINKIAGKIPEIMFLYLPRRLSLIHI